MTNNEKIQAFYIFLESKGSSKQELHDELLNYSTPIELFHNKLVSSLEWNDLWCSRRSFFYFPSSLKGSNYWRDIFRSVPGTTLVENVLQPYLQKRRLTNEEILAMFLKKHRLYSKYKKNCNKHYPEVVTIPINKPFFLLPFNLYEEKFNFLFPKWQKVVERFNLTGSITFSKLPK